MVMLMVVKHMIRKISGLNLYLMWRCYFRLMNALGDILKLIFITFNFIKTNNKSV